MGGRFPVRRLRVFNRNPHGYGSMKKGDEEVRGDWYYGKYVGDFEQYAEKQRKARASETRSKVFEHI